MPRNTAPAITATRVWLERAVIGLNLCPFARAPYLGEQVHFAVSDGVNTEAIAEALMTELQALVSLSEDERETTLLILTGGLSEFDDFVDFLALTDDLLAMLELDGVFQIASFHPDYQFADTSPEDIENYTNRSPWPILHILRESSVSRAVDALQDPDEIYRANMERLRSLGKAGWDRLWSGDA